MTLLLTDHEARYGCGIGQGSRCCKFLLNGEEGWICGRETGHKQRLIEVEGYTAQRLPTEPYPECQLPGARVQ
jgi:hypothetical protein